MPPALLQSSIGSLLRCSKPRLPIPIRSFSTTSSLSAIGPENPKFIHVPEPPQSQDRPKLNLKGTLPPPRKLFPTGSEYKTTPEYFATVTPEPQHESEPANEFVAWKRRMAENRRKNLREGLTELKERKIAADIQVSTLGRDRAVRREKRVLRPEREDERLTHANTIDFKTLKRQMKITDLNYPLTKARKGRQNLTKHMKHLDRMNSLHTLYMNARSFIVTEEQLDAEIEKIFVPNPHQEQFYDDNIWTVLGKPPTVSDMLTEVNNTQREAMAYYASPAALTGKRVGKIAEELTGGKMDD